MIKTRNLFFANFITKNLIVMCPKLGVLAVSILDKRKRIKIKFKKKKKKTAIIIPAPNTSNFFINSNTNVQYNVNTYSHTLKRFTYPLKNKIR